MDACSGKGLSLVTAVAALHAGDFASSEGRCLALVGVVVGVDWDEDCRAAGGLGSVDSGLLAVSTCLCSFQRTPGRSMGMKVISQVAYVSCS